MKNQKGLSLIVSLLMVILLIFVAIGIFWFVTRNVLQEGAGQFELSSKCLEVDISATSAVCWGDLCNVTLYRKPGGDAIEGVRLVLTDGTSSYQQNVSGNMASAETKTETSIDTGLTAPNKVDVVVYFKDSAGKEQACPQPTSYSF